MPRVVYGLIRLFSQFFSILIYNFNENGASFKSDTFFSLHLPTNKICLKIVFTGFGFIRKSEMMKEKYGVSYDATLPIRQMVQYSSNILFLFIVVIISSNNNVGC